MFSTLNEANTALEQKDLQIKELTKKLQSTQLSMKMLQQQVEQLIRRVYGKRSEKIDPRQMMFDNFIMESIEQPQPATTPESLPEQAVKRKKPRNAKRNHPGRIPVPEHLERVEIVLDVPEEEKVCPETGKPLKKIGEEVSEKLEYKPGKLIVNVYKRPKYGSPDSMASGDVGVVTAPMPDHPIEKCKADVGLIAHIIVSKFADHLPLYRQDGIFEREGVIIPRSTQTSWILQTYEAISPLENALKEAVLESDILFTDDSIIPLQIKGNGRVKKGRLWVYVRGGSGPPLCVFDFSQDRSKKRPIGFLGNYRGYIHADAYSGYDELKQTILPSEPLMKAITYALNQKEALYRYLENGLLKPDNNTAENAIRPLALGRKNWMFAGSDRGAKATALYLGLIQSCKACNVNPWEYFNDILRRIMSHPVSRLRELLPDKWKTNKS